MAAYRSCEMVEDWRTGRLYDYSRKTGLLYSEIVTPEEAPDWATDRAELWNRSEEAHSRSNAVIAREIQLSLPHELNADARCDLAREFTLWMVESYGIAIDLNLHAPDEDGDARNYHAHLLLCLRRFDDSEPTGLSRQTVREFDAVACQRAGEENHVTLWREAWEAMLNNALQKGKIKSAEGAPVIVDCRSYERQGKTQEPTIKEGAVATAKKRRGDVTERGRQNDEIRKRNERKKQKNKTNKILREIKP